MRGKGKSGATDEGTWSLIRAGCKQGEMPFIEKPGWAMSNSDIDSSFFQPSGRYVDCMDVFFDGLMHIQPAKTNQVISVRRAVHIALVPAVS
jgi:hypothetical protein